MAIALFDTKRLFVKVERGLVTVIIKPEDATRALHFRLTFGVFRLRALPYSNAGTKMLRLAVVFCFLVLGLECEAAAQGCDESVQFPGVGLSAANADAARVEKYLQQLQGTTLFADCHTEGSYLFYRQWYEDHAPIHRITAQTLALLTIVLGALIPVIAQLERWARYQKLIVALLAVGIVLAQGMAQVFNNDGSWKAYTLAKMKLEFAYQEWQTDVVNAGLDVDTVGAIRVATQKFSAALQHAVLEETGSFFDTRLTASGKAGQQSSSDQVAK